MCGIIGQINFDRTPISELVFNNMRETLYHRGPDGFDSKFFNNNSAALGHRRLSIIDLSDKAKQPMTNEDKTLWLVFNGEIYNYKELRKVLIEDGHHFMSDSDSEVILHGYEKWGKDILGHLRGIFAFCIYDIYKRKCFIARDHLGVKPLFYHLTDKTFIFSSESKAILEYPFFKREIDPDSFGLYLKYGNVPSEYSIFKEIKKIKPGHLIEIDQNNNFKIEKYWQAKFNPKNRGLAESKDLLKTKIEEAIEIQKVSDVPIGVLLSGGVDSTIVTGVLAKSTNQIQSFSIGFNVIESDESKYASIVSDFYQTKHISNRLNSAKALTNINALVTSIEEPFHFNGLIPYLTLSEAVNSNGVKVVMGGDGADELLAGYNWYQQFQQWSLKKNKFRTPTISLFGRSFFEERSLTDVEKYSCYNGYLTDYEIGKLTECFDKDLTYSILDNHYEKGVNPVLAAQIMDINCFMPDHCLTKVDRVSMSRGLEIRVPFLDVELVDFILTLDHEKIYYNNKKKGLLKEAMSSYFPDDLNVNRKKGFSSPLEAWLEESIGFKGKKLLFDGYLASNGFLNKENLKKMYGELSADKKMLLIGLELWANYWIEKKQIVL